jgi:hypothetical protein
MTETRRLACALAILASFAVVPFAAAAAPQIGNAELQVNTNTLSEVHHPAAAYDAAGHVMVVWENDLLGLRGRLYDTAGNALGGELALVTNASWSVNPGIAPVTLHHDPAVAFLPSGDFLLAWSEQKGTFEWTIFFQTLQVTSQEIMVQRFDVHGVAQGAPVTVSVPGAGVKSRPRLAVRAAGDVVATWMSSYGATTTPPSEIGVFARFLSGTGQTTGKVIHVDAGMTGGEVGSVPSLAVDPAGNFLVAWQGQSGTDTFDVSVYARLFEASGAPVDAAFSLTTGAVGPQTQPTVATNGQGNYLVAWQSYLNDVWHARIHGRIVDGSGNLVGKQTLISTGVNGTAETVPTAVPAPGNTYVLVWMEYNIWFPNGMAGVQVSATGAPLGNEVWINSQQIGAQVRTALATDGSGHMMAPYEAFFNKSEEGILARFFTAH